MDELMSLLSWLSTWKGIRTEGDINIYLISNPRGRLAAPHFSKRLPLTLDETKKAFVRVQ
jgi:hypothetical protein